MTTPPDFVAGQVLTAAQLNQAGLWLVKTQTIGTGVASVVVPNAFTTDFETYKVVIEGGAGSGVGQFGLTLGSTVTGYYSSVVYSTYAAGTVAGIAGGSVSIPYSGTFDGARIHMDMTIHNPFNTKYTLFNGAFVNVDAQGTVGGVLANSTSYTAFTLTCATGTVTGGVIRVYGYRE